MPPIPSPTLGLDVPPTTLTDSAIRRGVTGPEEGRSVAADTDPDDCGLLPGLPRELEYMETPGLAVDDADGDDAPAARDWVIGDWAQVRRDADPAGLRFEVGRRKIELAPGFTFRVAEVPGAFDGPDAVAFRMPAAWAGQLPGTPGPVCWIDSDLIEPGGDPAGQEPAARPRAGCEPVPLDIVMPSAVYFGFARRVGSLHAQMVAGHHRAVELGLKELAEEMVGKAVSL